MTFDLDAFRLSVANDPIIRDVWEQKYRFENEASPQATRKRVVDAILPGSNIAQHIIGNGYFCPAGRILAGAGTGRRVTMGNCFHSDEKFFTRDQGLVSFADVVGQEVSVLTKQGWEPAFVRSFGVQQLSKITFRPAKPCPESNRNWQGNSKLRLTVKATPDHRWFLVNGLVTTQIKVGDTVESNSAIPDLESSQYRSGFRHGLVFGDGSLANRHPRTGFDSYELRLCGERKQTYVSVFEEIERRWDGRDTKCERARISKALPSWIDQNDVRIFVYSKTNLKEIPITGLHTDYYAGFVAGWAAADGHLEKRNGTFAIHSQSRKALDWLVENAPLAGYFPVGDRCYGGTETNFGKRKAPLNKISLRHHTKPTAWRVVSIEPDEPAEVFCAVVPFSRAFTLASGIYTSNCYVAGTIMDSMPGIQRAIMQAALTMQQGGGHGSHYGTIRPNGARVNRTGSVSSGMLPFADQQSAMCSTIMSAGVRRGAMMLTLRDDHPDLWNGEQFETTTDFIGQTILRNPSFISAKRQKGRLTNFNVSVMITDAFMQAVEKGDDWDLGFHVPRADGNHVCVYDKPFPYDYYEIDNECNEELAIKKGTVMPWYVYRRVPARRIWEDLMRSTYTYAEPGVIFVDKVNKNNNLNYCEEIWATNPCLTGETLIVVARKGPIPIRELAEQGQDVPVFALDKTTRQIVVRMGRNPRLTKRQAKVVKVHLDDGTIRCTENHRFMLRNKTEVPAGELKEGDSLERMDLVPLAQWGIAKTLKVDKEARSNSEFNHKVVRVADDGFDDVYNITVDEHHNYMVASSWSEDGFSCVAVLNCGEQPLPPHGICNLGSINLAFLVKHPFTSEAHFDYNTYCTAIDTGVRFLDQVLDKMNYPLRAQYEESMLKRRIGLGITGLGDALLQLGIIYGSPEALDFSDTLAATLKERSYLTSIDLGEELGSFKAFDLEQFGKSPNLTPDIRNYLYQKGAIRNGVINTIAPNGTISLYLGNLASGVEPVFSFAKTRRRVRQSDGGFKEYDVVNYSQRMFEAMYPGEPLPEYFVGAMDITPEQHVDMQAVWQQHIDSSISKTCNVPTEMSYEDFKNVYWHAYESGCKGCTTYRYDPEAGRGFVLAEESQLKEKETKDASDETTYTGTVAPRPATLDSRTYKIRWPSGGRNGYHNLYVTVSRDQSGVPMEVFITTKEAEHHEWVTALGRMITAILRRGGDVRFLPHELMEVHSAAGGGWIKGRFRPSVVAAIGGVIEEEFAQLGILTTEAIPPAVEERYEGEPLLELEEKHDTGSPCPKCHAPTLVHEAGCSVCKTCGYSTCE